MARKLSLVLLIVMILSMALSLTSCDAVGGTVADTLASILPDPNSSSVAKLAHDLVRWIGEQFDRFLEFSFSLAESVWEWLDNTFGITDKMNKTATAIDLIKTGEFKNILAGIEIIFGCGVLLLGLAILVAVAIAIAVVIEFFGEFLLVAISTVAMIAVLVFAVIGFIQTVLPFLKF